MSDTRNLAADGTWRCEHEHFDGTPASATVLSGRAAPNSSHPPTAVTCSECGTRWRVWLSQDVAKLCIDTSASSTTLRRSPQLPIDDVIARVRAVIPDVIVTQLEQPHPADDDAVWFFARPDRDDDVQVEPAGPNEHGHGPFSVCDATFESAEAAATRIVAALSDD